MAKPRRSWTVTPHDALVQHEENLWSVEGMVPGAPFRRRMSIVRRSDGALTFFNAVPLGKPAFLVVGHHQHVIDAHAFAERLGLKVFGPKRVERALRERCDLAGGLEDLPKDPAVSVESLPGSKLSETVMIVRSGDRQSVIFSDAIQNNPVEQTVFMFRLLGFAGGPKTPLIFRVLFLEDRRAMRSEFERLAALPGLKRIIPCHGNIVENGAADALRAAAAAL